MPDDLPEECCAKCRFGEEFAEGDDAHCSVFQCRRFPPAFTQPFSCDVTRLDVYRQALECSSWPFVLCDDWCGEFQPRKESS